MPKKKTVMKNKMSSNLRLGMKSLRLLPLQAIVMVHPTNKQHLPTTKLRILTIIIIVTMQEEATNNHISLLRVLSHRKTCHSSGSPNMKTSQKLKKASFQPSFKKAWKLVTLMPNSDYSENLPRLKNIRITSKRLKREKAQHLTDMQSSSLLNTREYDLFSAVKTYMIHT